MADLLLPGESLVQRSHRHWVLLIESLLLPWAAAAVLMALLVVLPQGLVQSDYRVIAVLAVVMLVGAWTILAWIRWASASFIVTDQRVILSQGVISHSSKVIALDRIQDIGTRQSLLGRLLGYGTVEIDAAASAGKESLSHLPRPEEFRDLIFQEVESRRGWSVVPQGRIAATQQPLVGPPS